MDLFKQEQEKISKLLQRKNTSNNSVLESNIKSNSNKNLNTTQFTNIIKIFLVKSIIYTYKYFTFFKYFF